MARRPGNEGKDVRPAEDLSAELEDLLDLAHERGRVARSVGGRAQGRRTPVYTRRPDKADITRLLKDDLREALEDEIVPAVDAGPGNQILSWELEREISKKALVGLKLHNLRQLAERLQLDKRGRAEDLAERIGRLYRFDERQIAELILENQDEPEPDTGQSDRLFPLERSPEVAAVAERFDWIVGRYIRVGVARWFVFEDLELIKDRLRVAGTLRSYDAFVHAEGTAGPTLGATPTESRVEFELRSERPMLRVRRATAANARAAAKALETVAGVQLLGYLPRLTPATGAAGLFDDRTVLMLDLIHNRLRRAGARDPNLTVARFRLSEDDHQPLDEDARPSLRAVRFEGDWLLDSIQACQLIAVEGRALVDLSLFVTVQTEHGESSRLPIRFSLDRDNVHVVTGLARHRAEESFALQERLIQIVEAALSEGVEDLDRLLSLAERITERAHAHAPVDHPTMLDEAD